MLCGLWRKRGDNPFLTDLHTAGIDERPRHTSVRLLDETLFVFYTRLGDVPERLMLSTIDVSERDFERWDTSYPPEEIPHAESHWEGGDVAPSPSTWDFAPEDVNQIRDPYYFEDGNGRRYLFYAGRGEDAIGVAGVEFEGED